MREYLRGRLPADRALEVDRHLEQCENCLAVISRWETHPDSVVSKLRDLPPPDDFLQEPCCQAAIVRVKSLAARFSRAASAATWSSPLTVPGQLGDYQLLELLGGGGMGAVYRARHTKLDRIVALKTLLGARMYEPTAIARFEREMHAVGRLKHPHIVEAFDAREIDGIRFLVMEYIEGTTFAGLCRELGPLAIADACELICQAAEGLQYVCEQGLIHRDIKPSNLMLAFSGQVKILDLGLARFIAAAQGEEITGVGCVMGTADYMAPEQMRDSREIDIRADIYGLGGTLYRLLTGQPPFPGRRAAVGGKAEHACEPVPRIPDIRADVPEGLQAVLDRMLAWSTNRRFSQPADVAAALRPFAAGAQIGTLIARLRGEGAIEAKGTSSHGADETAIHAQPPAAPRGAQPAPGHRTLAASRPMRFGLACILVTLTSVAVLAPVIGRNEGGKTLPVGGNNESSAAAGEPAKAIPSATRRAAPDTTDWERHVALSAIEAGGRLRILTREGKSPRDVDRVEALPAEPFAIQVLMFFATSKVGDSDLEMIANLRRLQGISIEQVPVTDRGLSGLTRISTLRWLFLSDTRVSADGLIPLRSLTDLETLGLAGLPITDDALAGFAGWKRMTHLFLSRTAVTDSGLPSLTALTSLSHLDLRNTAITDAGLEELKNIPTLRSLDLRGTGVTLAAVEKFRQAMPQCDVQSGRASN